MLTEKEKQFILANRQQVSSAEMAEKLQLSSLVKSRNMWLAMGQYFSSNFTFFFTLTWLFPHIKTRFGLDALEASFYSSAPLLFGAFGNWFSGWWVDSIYRAGKWKASRKIPAITGFLLAAFGLIASIFMDTAFGAVVFLSIAIFGADMTLSPSWSFCVDIGRKNSGAVSGTMNMAGNIGSFITALAFPYLLAWTASNNTFFLVGAGLNLLAVIFWQYMDPEKEITRK